MSVIIQNTSGGGIRIKDATATRDDVAEGMIFYNNDGRQVGTGKMVKKIVMPKRSGTYVSKSIRDGFIYPGNGYSFRYIREITNNNLKGHYNGIDGVKNIVGVEIDGQYSSCPSLPGEYTVYAYVMDDGDQYPWFYHYGTTVYYAYIINGQEIPSNVRNRQIIIYYID